MKRSLYLLFAVALLAAGCGTRNSKQTSVESPDTPIAAIDRFLVDSIGTHYSSADVSIPFHSFTVIDKSDPEGIRVLGDFWLMNYIVAGDTLKSVSGGAHPGAFLLKADAQGRYEVISFDPVGDGSEFLPSVRRIFGDKADAFLSADADAEKREAALQAAIALFVQEEGLPVHYYQDFGWPAVRIPEAED